LKGGRKGGGRTALKACAIGGNERRSIGFRDLDTKGGGLNVWGLKFHWFVLERERINSTRRGPPGRRKRKNL